MKTAEQKLAEKKAKEAEFYWPFSDLVKNYLLCLTAGTILTCIIILVEYWK